LLVQSGYQLYETTVTYEYRLLRISLCVMNYALRVRDGSIVSPYMLMEYEDRAYAAQSYPNR
jgi:hypothetical protein